jgi:hypothetical protein
MKNFIATHINGLSTFFCIVLVIATVASIAEAA